jgi:2-amino-5-formylamino-6-ribosylaminopyrimidin-4(3H)-one 5'-monophosphate deformylase
MITEIGVLALGSHDERHGTVLPLDTDAKIASHIALEAAKKTGARFLGVIQSSYELPDIDTGHHHTLEQLLDELRTVLLSARNTLGIKGAVLVNGHGGNDVLREHLMELEEKVGIRLIFNNKVVELEGPHAGTGEVSIGAVMGIADTSRLADHTDFERHPEVGFVGLKSARKQYDWAEQHARHVTEKGVHIDYLLGGKLLQLAVLDVADAVRKLRER